MGSVFSKKAEEKEESIDENNILRHGTVEFEYPDGSKIHRESLILTKEDLYIYKNNKPAHKVNLKNIKNIDSTIENNTFQVFLDEQNLPFVKVSVSDPNEKQKWVDSLCSSVGTKVILEQKQKVKTTVRHLGFEEADIDEALKQYEKRWGTVYNVNVLVEILTNQQEEKEYEELQNKDQVCAICKEAFTEPVKNIFGRTYCKQCISNWYNICVSSATMDNIRDPYSSICLPGNNQLLYPHFSMMAEIWNHNNKHNSKKKISQQSMNKLKYIDTELEKQRVNIVNISKKTLDGEYTSNALKLLAQSKDFCFSKENLSTLFDDMLDHFEYYEKINELVKEGSKIFNQYDKKYHFRQSEKIYSDANGKILSEEFQDLHFKSATDTKLQKLCEKYNVDLRFANEIKEKTIEIMKLFHQKISECKAKNLNNKQIKNVLVSMFLERQTKECAVAINEAKDNENETKPTKLKFTTNKKFKTAKMEYQRIFFDSNKDDLVSTKTTTEVMECINKKKPYELYFRDSKSKPAMTKKKGPGAPGPISGTRRFTQTSHMIHMFVRECSCICQVLVLLSNICHKFLRICWISIQPMMLLDTWM